MMTAMATAAAVPVVVIERRINEIDQQIGVLDRLRAERDMLVELVKQATTFAADCIGGRPGPTRAVMAHISINPGITQSQIVAALKNSISTDSQDPERVLYQTLQNLRGMGKIIVDENKKVFLAGGGG